MVLSAGPFETAGEGVRVTPPEPAPPLPLLNIGELSPPFPYEDDVDDVDDDDDDVDDVVDKASCPRSRIITWEGRDRSVDVGELRSNDDDDDDVEMERRCV